MKNLIIRPGVQKAAPIVLQDAVGQVRDASNLNLRFEIGPDVVLIPGSNPADPKGRLVTFEADLADRLGRGEVQFSLIEIVAGQPQYRGGGTILVEGRP